MGIIFLWNWPCVCVLSHPAYVLKQVLFVFPEAICGVFNEEVKDGLYWSTWTNQCRCLSCTCTRQRGCRETWHTHTAPWSSFSSQVRFSHFANSYEVLHPRKFQNRPLRGFCTNHVFIMYRWPRKKKHVWVVEGRFWDGFSQFLGVGGDSRLNVNGRKYSTTMCCVL